MTKPLLVSVAALALSVVALVLSLGSRGDAPAGDRPLPSDDNGASASARSTVRDDSDDSDVGLRRRVAALEADLVALRRRIGTTPGGGGQPTSALTAASQVEREEAEAALLDAIDGDPEVREKLEGLVSESLRKENERRWESRRARWEERGQERLDALAEEASLRPEQKSKLSAMLSAEREEMTALFQKAREESGGRREMRDQLRELRARTDENARAVLDDDQVPAYEAMREDEGPGRGRRGRDRERNEQRTPDER